MKIARSLFCFLFCLCFVASISAQNYTHRKNASKKILKLWDKANSEMREEKMDAALLALDKITDDDPNFIDAHILRGKLLHDQGKLAEAETSFEQALRLDAQYDPANFYLLGLIEWKADKFGEAAEHFQNYLDTENTRDYLVERSERHRANALFAQQAVQNPLPFNPVSLGENINTAESGELWPSLTADESFLIYTKRIQGQEDLYFSQKTDGEWGVGQSFEGLNTPLNEGTQTIAADGRTLVFTACNRRGGLGSCDLFFVALNGNYFSAPVNMGPPVNSSAWDSQPSLSSDGRTLFFASERSGGLGDRDIWMSRLQADGYWGKPTNLGPNINTSQGDQAPFIHPDGQTLYFMSNGRPGMGGFDLYRSQKQADGSWGEAQNLGYPINTKANEGAIFINLDGTKAYFTSDKAQEKGRGSRLLASNNEDLYYFELPPAIRPRPVTYVRAKVYDAKTKQPLIAKAEIGELEAGSMVTEQKTNAEGSFLICLPTGADYSLTVDREGYLFYSEHFALQQVANAAPFILDIPLQPIPVSNESAAAQNLKENEPVILKNVFFETGFAALKPTSRAELDRLKNLLDKNPGLRIQINGHTDKVGSEADNQLLSEQRAKAVYDYLLEAGVDANRLQYEGYGESRPIADNDTEEGRRQNRRTEFVVLGK